MRKCSSRCLNVCHVSAQAIDLLLQEDVGQRSPSAPAQPDTCLCSRPRRLIPDQWLTSTVTIFTWHLPVVRAAQRTASPVSSASASNCTAISTAADGRVIYGGYHGSSAPVLPLALVPSKTSLLAVYVFYFNMWRDLTELQLAPVEPRE